MRNFNWLVQKIFYKHKDRDAIINKNCTDKLFYDVGFIDQLHANLCTAASENMLYHFSGKPIATMVKNPRGIMEGDLPSELKSTAFNDYLSTA